MVRGLGGGLASSVVAPVITLGTMGYYDYTDPTYNPTGLDYYGKGGRAFVVGGTSGFMASALTFALFGAALGPVGIVVGFLIGVAAYLLIDYLVGEQVEQGLRAPFE